MDLGTKRYLDFKQISSCFGCIRNGPWNKKISRFQTLSVKPRQLVSQPQNVILVTKTSAANLKTKTGNHAATKMSDFPTKVSYLRISSKRSANKRFWWRKFLPRRKIVLNERANPPSWADRPWRLLIHPSRPVNWICPSSCLHTFINNVYEWFITQIVIKIIK